MPSLTVKHLPGQAAHVTACTVLNFTVGAQGQKKDDDAKAFLFAAAQTEQRHVHKVKGWHSLPQP